MYVVVLSEDIFISFFTFEERKNVVVVVVFVFWGEALRKVGGREIGINRIIVNDIMSGSILSEIFAANDAVIGCSVARSRHQPIARSITALAKEKYHSGVTFAFRLWML